MVGLTKSPEERMSLPSPTPSAAKCIDISNCEEGMWPFGLAKARSEERSCSASMVMRLRKEPASPVFIVTVDEMSASLAGGASSDIDHESDQVP